MSVLSDKIVELDGKVDQLAARIAAQPPPTNVFTQADLDALGAIEQKVDQLVP